MDKLLPCPFCGAENCQTILSGDRFYVACGAPDCFCALGEIWDRDAMPDHQFATKAEAIAAWNRRAHPNQQDKGS